MTDQRNLFASPNRPKRLIITVERRWDLGEMVLDLTETVKGSKGEGVVWSATGQYEGEFAPTVVAAILEGGVMRFTGSLWDVKPTLGTVESWRAHWGA